MSYVPPPQLRQCQYLLIIFFYIFLGNNYWQIDVPYPFSIQEQKYFLLPNDQVGAKPTPRFHLFTWGRVLGAGLLQGSVLGQKYIT